MTSGRRRRGETGRNEASTARLELSQREVETLVRIATYYERSMGPMRHVIRLTSRGEMRRRLAFITEEGRWLRLLAQTTLDDMAQEGSDQVDMSLTPRALIAFWSRLIASLESRRSRRRLSPDEVEVRERLSDKLRDAARVLSRRDPGGLRRELETRRPREADRMRQELTPDP